MRRAVVLAVVTTALLSAGCGDEGTTTRDPAKALEYMPVDPALLAIVDTDVDGDQVEGFEDTVGDGSQLGDVEKLIEDALKDTPLSYEDDVEPLLGGPLVVGVEDETLFAGGDGSPVAALVVDDEDKLQDTLDKLPGVENVTLVEDGVLLAAPDREALARARARKEAGSGLDPSAVDGALRDLSEDALLKVYADLDDGALQLPQAAPLARDPWIRTLTTLGATISFDGSEMRADALLSTDHAREEHFPLVSGTSEVPEIVRRDGWISGANLDQSRTTVFLLRLVRAAFPDSAFVRDVATVERERGIDFEREFLRQFNGPSQSLLNPDGRFAARSTVRDPEQLARTMEKIAPDLGRLVEDLQALRSTGLGALLLLAPDAPAATSVLDSANVRVESLGDDLYRMTGLVGPGPDSIVFGLVDDVFVVAEDEDAAQEIAVVPAERFDGPPGPAVARTSGDVLQSAAADFLGLGSEGRLASEVSGSLSVEEDGLRGRLVAEFGD